jgi:hypothetical protein
MPQKSPFEWLLLKIIPQHKPELHIQEMKEKKDNESSVGSI